MSLYYDLFKDDSNILYYNNYNLIDSLKAFQINPTKERAQHFIKDYFSAGGKETVFIMDFQQEYLDRGKHLHTVALYLLGCHLSRFVDVSLKNHFSDRIRSVDWYEFQYTWFLTSLYHDASWVLESGAQVIGKCGQVKTLDYHLGKNSIENNLFQYMGKNINFSNSTTNSRIKRMNNSYFTFPESLIRNYFFYRVDCMHTVDHGIIAGYIMFDRLIKNYEQVWLEKYKESDNGNYKNFNHIGLSWRIEHQTHFACVANAIIAHNIWFCKCNEESKYKRYGIEPLFSSTAEKISLSKWPLVFFLGLLDTIEPVKRFEDKMDITEIWKQLSINAMDGEVLIEMGSDLKAQCSNGYEKWIDAIYSMPDWLSLRLIPEVKDQVESTIRIIPMGGA